MKLYMRGYKGTLQEHSWFLLLILLLVAGLFLYIGNGIISALLEHYDNRQNPPVFQENLYKHPDNNNHFYLFCHFSALPEYKKEA